MLTAAASGLRTIVVRAVGFDPASQLFPRSQSEIIFRLERRISSDRVTILPGIAAHGTAPIPCPERTDDSAMKVWERLQELYRPAPMNTGMVAHLFWRISEQAALPTFVDDVPVDSTAWGWAGIHQNLRHREEQMVLRRAYARPIPGGTSPAEEKGYFHWAYLSLHRWSVDHFVLPGFAVLNNFSLHARSDGRHLLRFCSRKDVDPGIDGWLLLRPDDSLEEAAWHFTTRRPRQDAGGHAWYVAVDSTAERSPLMPYQSVFYRLLGPGQNYLVDAAIFRGIEYHDP